MSEGRDDDESREHAPSARKLEKAREEGDVPRAQDLQSAIGLMLLTGGIALFGSALVQAIGRTGQALLRLETAGDGIWGAAPGALLLLIGRDILPWLGVVLLAPGIGVLVFAQASRSLTFTPSRLRPRLSRINPMAQIRQRFGIDGLAEFAKNLVKIAAVLALLGLSLIRRADPIMNSLHQSPAIAAATLTRECLILFALVVALSIAIGGADYLWQILRHLQRNRMSRKELTEEARESEGDPHARQARRARAQEIALNRMLADVPKADVIVVNPEHYAVALAWDRRRGSAPKCLAKGVDEIAARIRERAIAAGVPIHPDPPTARALHACLEIGHEVPPEHYRAVAAAIRFAERMRRIQRERGS